MYRSTRKPEPRLQKRHQQVNELLQETMTIRDAAVRHGVSPEALRSLVRRYEPWQPSPGVARYYISDIEQAVREIKQRIGQG